MSRRTAAAHRAKQIRKALVAGATVATAAITQGLIAGTAAKLVGLALVAAGTYGVYAVKNSG